MSILKFKQVEPKTKRTYLSVPQVPYESIEFFIHGETGNYNATEKSTGFYIISHARTIKEAIQYAYEKIQSVSPQKMQECMDYQRETLKMYDLVMPKDDKFYTVVKYHA